MNQKFDSSLIPHPSPLNNGGEFIPSIPYQGGYRGPRGNQRGNQRGPQVRTNERIRAKEIRVIDEEGQIGVMTPQEALRLARERGLDLVEVAPTAQPPVCKIIDFGKYLYEQKKRAHEAKKKQVTIEVKEIKFRPSIDEHDYNFKMKHAVEILKDGNKVKATVRFKGREITHKELGAAVIERLIKDLSESGVLEARPRLEGMQMIAIFNPKK